MESSLDTKTTDEICSYITKISEVKGIESIHSIPTGYKYMLVVTILVEGNLETYKSHEIADRLQEEIEENFEEVDRVIVHVEPIKEEK